MIQLLITIYLVFVAVGIISATLQAIGRVLHK
jgi:hypothetical protein